jgi:hypothetical protein
MTQRMNPGAERQAQRREREDSAPRLLKEVPDALGLDLRISECRLDNKTPEHSFIKRVVVEHAAAHFEIPCGNPECKDGGHDVTYDIIRAMRAKQESFEGENECMGTVGSTNAPCGRTLRYVATARYRA